MPVFLRQKVNVTLRAEERRTYWVSLSTNSLVILSEKGADQPALGLETYGWKGAEYITHKCITFVWIILTEKQLKNI